LRDPYVFFRALNMLRDIGEEKLDVQVERGGLRNTIELECIGYEDFIVARLAWNYCGYA
jgi:hypothetical protein